MSVVRGFAPEISAIEPRLQRSQFHAGNIGGPFQFVSSQGLAAQRRNACIMPRAGEYMQGYRSGRAILFSLLLCSAFGVGEGSAQPSTEDIARGKALVEAGDCA